MSSDLLADSARNSLAVLGKRCASLRGQRNRLLREQQSLRETVGLAKGRLAYKDDIEGVLYDLQMEAHARSVGIIETLLSGILADIHPEAGDVVLDPYMERDLPALRIQRLRSGGQREAITSGCLTNTVSAGLRYVALARSLASGLRPFIMLDEPDCWVETSRIPAFANVLHRLADEVGIQTLLITHHALDAFAAQAQIIPLRVTPGSDGYPRIEVGEVQGPFESWADDQPGIRGIRLRNVMSFQDSYLPLGPQVSVITAPNDAGKSVISLAIKSVAYGRADETMIRHGAASAVVEFDLEAGHRLIWTYRRQRNKRESYELVDASGTVVAARTGSGVPEWVSERLGIAIKDGLDIQIGNQTSPIFLLDKPATQQASILSVGRESGYVQHMLAAYKEMAKEDAATVKRGESDLNRLDGDLRVLSPLDDLEQQVDTLEEQFTQLRAFDALLARLESLHEHLNQCQSRQQAAMVRLQPLRALPAIPDLPGVERLPDLIDRLDQAQRVATTARHYHQALSRLPELPVMPDVAALESCQQHLNQCQTRQQAASMRLQPLRTLPAIPDLPGVERLPDLIDRLDQAQRVATTARHYHQALSRLPELPVLPDVATVTTCGKRLRAARTQWAAAQAQHISVTTQMQDTQGQITALLTTLGQCPLCGSMQGNHHHD